MEIMFKVQGSAELPYEVTFKNDEELTAKCSCPAGEKKQLCKHRLQILYGVLDGIVSGNEADVATVASWLPGSKVERALLEVEQAEQKVEEAKKAVSVAKKQLNRILEG